MGVERITYEDIMSSVPHLESRDVSCVSLVIHVYY